VYQENQGPSVARNRGVEEASQRYIAFLDADDLWRPEKAGRQASFLEAHPEVALVCSDYVIEEGGGRSRVRARHLDYRQDDLLESLYLRGGPVMMSTVMLRKQVFEEVGGFDPDIPKGQDTDLWLRIVAGHRIHHLPEPLVVKRRRAGSVGENIPEKVEYLREITDRMAEVYPRLEPLRELRHGMLSEKLSRYWLERGDQNQSRNHALEALYSQPSSITAISLFLLSLFPLSSEKSADLLRNMGNARRFIDRVKNKVVY
jgi:glycosyltransferase involved in cell wall biosynthesis